MKLARFSAILEAYGAAPERWPEHERAAALMLARSSIQAARELAQARVLDDALYSSGFPDIAAEPGRFTFLHSRIVAAARPNAQSWTQRWFGFDLAPSQLWPSVAGLALATLLGFATGISGLSQAEVSHDAYDSLALPSIDLPANGQ